MKKRVINKLKAQIANLIAKKQEIKTMSDIYIGHDITMQRGEYIMRCYKHNLTHHNQRYISNRVCPDCGSLKLISPANSMQYASQNGNQEQNTPIEEKKTAPITNTTVVCEKCNVVMEQTSPGYFFCKEGHKKVLMDLVQQEQPVEQKKDTLSKRKRRIDERCPQCGKVAAITSENKIFGKIKRTYECGHTFFVDPLAIPESRDSIWTKLYPFQQKGVEFVEENNYNALIGDEMGLGKAQSLNTPILTPCGYRRNGDLKVGDTVCTPNGEIAQIDGIYPQGIRPIYRVTFTDNTSTECDLEHLWNVQTPNWKFRFGPNYFETLTLQQIIDSGLRIKNGNLKYYIPVTEPVQMCEKPLSFDPYLLGLLLGDGCLCGKSITFASESTELPQKFCNEGFDVTQVADQNYRIHDCKEFIEQLGLNECKSNNKFIPENYLYNSIPNRLAILQGLMDTDGFISKDGTAIQYTTISEKLKDGVKFLVQSLGGIAYESSRVPNYTYNGAKLQGQLAYTLTITLPNEIIPFRLIKKLLRCKPKTKYLPNRAIKSIEYLRDDEAQCIHINHPDHLYLTNDCIVTHNTIQALATLRYNYENLTPCLIVCEASKVYDWAAECRDWVNDKFTERKDKPQIHFSGTYGIAVEANIHIISMSLLQKPKVLKSIIEYGFKFLIVDESHSFKNDRSERTYALQQLAKDIDYKLFLSGTPIMNKVMEYFVPLNMLKRAQFPSKAWLADRCDKSSSGRILGISKWFRPKFFAIIDDIVIRRTKKDAGIKLPKLRINKHAIALNDDKMFKRGYGELVDKLEKILNEKKEAKGLTQELLGIFAQLRHITGVAKVRPILDLVYEFLESTDQDQKICIGVHHKLVGELMEQGLKEFNPISMSDEAPEVKMRKLDNFKKLENRVLIASILGCGQGLNIQFCKNAVIMEREWNPAKEEQFIGRFQRITKNEDGTLKEEFDDATDSVQIDICNAEKSIDSFFQALLDLKSEIVNSTLDEDFAYNPEFLMELAYKIVETRRMLEKEGIL